MIDLSKIFGRRKVASKDMAKDRLKLVLVHDRANTDTEFLQQIKDEIMKVLEKYMDISDSGLDIRHFRQRGIQLHRKGCDHHTGKRLVFGACGKLNFHFVKVFC